MNFNDPSGLGLFSWFGSTVHNIISDIGEILGVDTPPPPVVSPDDATNNIWTDDPNDISQYQDPGGGGTVINDPRVTPHTSVTVSASTSPEFITNLSDLGNPFATRLNPNGGWPVGFIPVSTPSAPGGPWLEPYSPPPPQTVTGSCMAAALVSNFVGDDTQAGTTVVLNAAAYAAARDIAPDLLPGPGWIYGGVAILYDAAQVTKSYVDCKQDGGPIIP